MGFEPARVDFTGRRPEHPPIRRGDVWSHAFTFYDDDGTTPLPMGASGDWLCQIRPDTEDPVTVAVTVVVSGASSNIVTLSLTKVQTAALTPGDYVYDAQKTNDGITWIEGAIVVVPDVSR